MSSSTSRRVTRSSSSSASALTAAREAAAAAADARASARATALGGRARGGGRAAALGEGRAKSPLTRELARASRELADRSELDAGAEYALSLAARVGSDAVADAAKSPYASALARARSPPRSRRGSIADTESSSDSDSDDDDAAENTTFVAYDRVPDGWNTDDAMVRYKTSEASGIGGQPTYEIGYVRRANGSRFFVFPPATAFEYVDEETLEPLTYADERRRGRRPASKSPRLDALREARRKARRGSDDDDDDATDEDAEEAERQEALDLLRSLVATYVKLVQAKFELWAMQKTEEIHAQLLDLEARREELERKADKSAAARSELRGVEKSLDELRSSWIKNTYKNDDGDGAEFFVYLPVDVEEIPARFRPSWVRQRLLPLSEAELRAMDRLSAISEGLGVSFRKGETVDPMERFLHHRFDSAYDAVDASLITSLVGALDDANVWTGGVAPSELTDAEKAKHEQQLLQWYADQSELAMQYTRALELGLGDDKRETDDQTGEMAVNTAETRAAAAHFRRLRGSAKGTQIPYFFPAYTYVAPDADRPSESFDTVKKLYEALKSKRYVSSKASAAGATKLKTGKDYTADQATLRTLLKRAKALYVDDYYFHTREAIANNVRRDVAATADPSTLHDFAGCGTEDGPIRTFDESICLPVGHGAFVVRWDLLNLRDDKAAAAAGVTRPEALARWWKTAFRTLGRPLRAALSSNKLSELNVLGGPFGGAAGARTALQSLLRLSPSPRRGDDA